MLIIKKILPLIFLLLPISLICQEYYDLVYLKSVENDSIIYDGKCTETLIVYDDFVERRILETNQSLKLMIIGQKNDAGYTHLTYHSEPPSNWFFKISKASEVFGENKLEEKDNDASCLIEFIYYDPNDPYKANIMYIARKKNIIHKNKLTIENLNLSVNEYLFIDSLGNDFCEKEYYDKGIRGHYSNLKIRCKKDDAVFSFTLKKEFKNGLFERKEIYNYKVVDNFMEDGFEYWKLLRNDGARLIFRKNNYANTYSLTIPADETAETLYVYIFTKI